MFYPGQKVVCVDAKPRTPYDATTGLTEGAVYTVCAMREDILADKLGVILFEIDARKVNPKRWGYYADRFRPAVEKKTNISVFKKALRTKRTKVPA